MIQQVAETKRREVQAAIELGGVERVFSKSRWGAERRDEAPTRRDTAKYAVDQLIETPGRFRHFEGGATYRDDSPT
jgi:hypothetical protein